MRKNSLVWAAGITAVLLCMGRFTAAVPALAAPGDAAGQQPVAPVVQNGTHFLVRLDGKLSTAKSKVNKKFDAVTLEPLETTNGLTLPAGAEVRGHISRVERGGMTSRAGLWLAFDDIETHHGRLPLVAEVSSVPGDFSVRQEASKEGEIEARSRKTAQEIEIAAGAAAGAVAGSDHGRIGAAIGGATGGVAGFAASSHAGQEVELPKGTKLDLVLDRPLYLAH